MSRLQWKKGPAFPASEHSGIVMTADFEGRKLEIHKAQFQDMYRGGKCRCRFWLTVDGAKRGSHEINMLIVKAQAVSMASWSELAASLVPAHADRDTHPESKFDVGEP